MLMGLRKMVIAFDQSSLPERCRLLAMREIMSNLSNYDIIANVCVAFARKRYRRIEANKAAAHDLAQPRTRPEEWSRVTPRSNWSETSGATTADLHQLYAEKPSGLGARQAAGVAPPRREAAIPNARPRWR